MHWILLEQGELDATEMIETPYNALAHQVMAILFQKVSVPMTQLLQLNKNLRGPQHEPLNHHRRSGAFFLMVAEKAKGANKCWPQESPSELKAAPRRRRSATAAQAGPSGNASTTMVSAPAPSSPRRAP